MTDVWRNFINKPKLSIYISNQVEVGYSHFGPTFAVAGTLASQNSVILVHNICATVTSPNNKTSHYMDWFAFRPANYILGNFSEMNLTMASKFTIAPHHTHTHNTLFIDNNHFSEMKSVLTAIKDSWEELLAAASKQEDMADPAKLFKEFKALKIIADAKKRLETMNYWEIGDYPVKIRVTTQNPKQVFDAQGTFHLAQKDKELLTENVDAIISNICQQPPVSYSCAAPALTIKNK